MTRWLPALMAAVVVAIMAVATPLGEIVRTIAVACVIASFLAAALLARKDVRTHASVIAGIAAVTAAGQVEGGVLYGVLVAIFLLGCVVCLRLAQQTSGSALLPSKARIAAIFAITGVIATASVLSLPPLAARVQRTMMGYFGVDASQQTAFSTRMVLGATHDLLQSDAIVARIDGGSPEYLRGAVYDEFDGGGWKTMEGRDRTKVGPGPGDAPVHMELDKSAPTGSEDLRWFLPVTACGFDHPIEIDAFGVARRESGDRHLRYSMTGCTPAPARGPTKTDLQIPPWMRDLFTRTAAAWVGDATTPKEKLRRIERELGKFEYSLNVPRQPGMSPMTDFLTVHKAGHCEFFASAMALTARTQGIQTRVIGGFRTTEFNPITHQTIVRDRNAHAWVEAWYDGAWHAWDPTPASGSPSMARSFLDHASDLWGLAWERLTSIGLLGYAIILIVIIGILLAVRSFGSFLRRPRRRRQTQAMDRPLPCFDTLMNALAAVGFERDESEPIEDFAGRIPNRDIASALTAYAAFRYGGVGEESAVVSAATQAAKATSSLRK